MGRRNRHELMMEVATLFAQQSTCKRLQVGAIIAKDNRTVSAGYNGAPSGMEHCNDEICNDKNPCTRTIHAEVNAIVFAARDGISTKGAVLYCTHAPCLDCSKAIINSGITHVIYKESYRDDEGIRLLASCGIEVDCIYDILYGGYAWDELHWHNDFSGVEVGYPHIETVGVYTIINNPGIQLYIDLKSYKVVGVEEY